jgi:hypothetical protein
MSLAAALIATGGVVLIVATLAGLFLRGRWSSWYAFTLYLATVAAFSIVFIAWPGAWTETLWLVQTNVINALRFAMAIELAARTFRSFPGARSTLRPALLAMLAVTLVLVFAIPSHSPDYRTILEELQPRLINGTVWLFTVIAALILWYRLPVSALHKSVLLAYVPYLLFELLYLRVLMAIGWKVDLLGYLYQAAYLVLASFWARAAWRSVG